jgi:hypothetical protein
MNIIYSERMAIERTLTARIHSVFSCVLNALHSLRIAGFVQELSSSGYGWLTVGQKVARASEKSLKTNIAEGEDVYMWMSATTPSQFISLERVEFTSNSSLHHRRREITK